MGPPESLCPSVALVVEQTYPCEGERGGAREYPWGDRFDPKKANLDIGDEKVDGTSPVGIYPSGASPYGVEELSGNVWEWCSTLFQSYPYNAEDGRENKNADGARVLRGGSWATDDEWFARCAARSTAPPAVFVVNRGCRVVVGSPRLS